MGECLHALLKRIDELEMRKAGVDQATSARSTDRPPSLGQLGKPLTFESSDPGSRHVTVETTELVGDDGTTKITKRTQVTERVMTTKTYQTVCVPYGPTPRRAAVIEKVHGCSIDRGGAPRRPRAQASQRPSAKVVPFPSRRGPQAAECCSVRFSRPVRFVFVGHSCASSRSSFATSGRRRF